MDKEEKMSKMYNYCHWKQCSNCKVDKENPSHECGGGKGYLMDYNMVSNKELDMNYKIAFGEIKEEEKKVSKFKVGDVVRIIGNKSSGHKFNIGEVAKIDKIYNEGTDREHYMASNESKSYYVSYVDIELFNKSTSKTLTITTSDSTTTLTDGTHTTSIKRYYIDKHNERNAVSIVIDKYYDELARIERVSKLPKVGDKVKVIDDGKTYDKYSDWLIKNNVSIESAIKWESGKYPKNGEEYTIKMIVDTHVLIEDDYSAYIISVEGLEVVK